jgi:hypothetical protein
VSDTRLVRRYKRDILRMLLAHRLDRRIDQLRLISVIDAIWGLLDEHGRHVVDEWVRSLPVELRKTGPAVRDDFDRANGDVECPICRMPYWEHPPDPREGSFELVVACNGRRWKL